MSPTAPLLERQSLPLDKDAAGSFSADSLKRRQISSTPRPIQSVVRQQIHVDGGPQELDLETFSHRIGRGKFRFIDL